MDVFNFLCIFNKKEVWLCQKNYVLICYLSFITIWGHWHQLSKIIAVNMPCMLINFLKPLVSSFEYFFNFWFFFILWCFIVKALFQTADVRDITNYNIVILRVECFIQRPSSIVFGTSADSHYSFYIPWAYYIETVQYLMEHLRQTWFST